MNSGWKSHWWCHRSPNIFFLYFNVSRIFLQHCPDFVFRKLEVDELSLDPCRYIYVPLKIVVGRRHFFWNGPFLGNRLLFGGGGVDALYNQIYLVTSVCRFQRRKLTCMVDYEAWVDTVWWTKNGWAFDMGTHPMKYITLYHEKKAGPWLFSGFFWGMKSCPFMWGL